MKGVLTFNTLLKCILIYIFYKGFIMVDCISLGATLFIPALHKDIDLILSRKKYKNLKSVLIDTEDSIALCDLETALKEIENLLYKIIKTDLLVFIRPRNLEILERILRYKNIDKIDGFILPKFSLDNAKEYLKVLEHTEHSFMPSIEGSELFDANKLIDLRDMLLPFSEKIILIRFGLEDMLRQLRMRRNANESIFELSATSSVVGNFIALFKSSGFEVSGGVYPYFRDDEGFKKDVLRDLKEGLFSKTIIHPSQISIVNELYKVTQEEYDEAQKIVTLEGEISSSDGKMLERNTMTPFAKFILQRKEIYGISQD